MAKSDPGHRRLVVKTDSPTRTRPNGKDRGGETVAESRFKGLRSRQDPHSERSRPDGREIWPMEGILGLLSENSVYEILNQTRISLSPIWALQLSEAVLFRGCGVL